MLYMQVHCIHRCVCNDSGVSFLQSMEAIELTIRDGMTDIPLPRHVSYHSVPSHPPAWTFSRCCMRIILPSFPPHLFIKTFNKNSFHSDTSSSKYTPSHTYIQLLGSNECACGMAGMLVVRPFGMVGLRYFWH